MRRNLLVTATIIFSFIYQNIQHNNEGTNKNHKYSRIAASSQ
jgi:hypothetical protein